MRLVSFPLKYNKDSLTSELRFIFVLLTLSKHTYVIRLNDKPSVPIVRFETR